jgi:hypothetical protein
MSYCCRICEKRTEIKVRHKLDLVVCLFSIPTSRCLLGEPMAQANITSASEETQIEVENGADE